MHPIEEKIVIAAKAMFMRYGIKSITMDDVAREMAVSKKTLYQYFADKSDLVKRVFQHHLHFISCACIKTFEEAPNPIDQMISISMQRAEEMSNMNPALLYDMKKYYPERWQELDQFKNEFIYNRVVENLNKGMEQGLYLPTLNTDLTARFYVYLVDIILNASSEIRNKYNQRELHKEMITYHLRAVCTSMGLAHLSQRLNEMTTQ